MKTYTYQQTLSIVEKFMKDSGIREYCSKVCKGGCCRGLPNVKKMCYDTDIACYRNEGRRLACSIYVGYGCFFYPIFYEKSNYEQKVMSVKYWTIICVVIEHIRSVVEKHVDNAYYRINTPEIQSNCSFNCKIIDQIKQIDTNKIKERIKTCFN